MTSAPSMNGCSSSLASNSSEGGHVEQPSDVNSSITTGVPVCLGGEEFMTELLARVVANANSQVIRAKNVPAALFFIGHCVLSMLNLTLYVSIRCLDIAEQKYRCLTNAHCISNSES